MTAQEARKLTDENPCKEKSWRLIFEEIKSAASNGDYTSTISYGFRVALEMNGMEINKIITGLGELGYLVQEQSGGSLLISWK